MKTYHDSIMNLLRTARAVDKCRVSRRLRTAFRLLAVILGGLYAWNARQAMTPDGISYLDMGDAYLRGDWAVAVNALWSPLYACLVGGAVWLFNPSPSREVPLVHLVNFAIYLSALISFDFFLHELIRYRRERESVPDADAGKPLPEWAWVALGYPLFMWTALFLTDVAAVTPDMCVSVFVYLASAILMRVRRGTIDRFLFAMLGAVLGFGYLAKAALFPLAFIFLLVAGLAAGDFRKAWSRVLLALILFLSVAGVYFVPLSGAVGRFTFGESGRLNYLWYISGVTPHIHWQGGPPGSGTPEHPTRKIYAAPAVYEFRTPIKATYPPWYDPAYWYEGARARFDLTGQLRALKTNLRTLAGILANARAVWIVCLFVLCLRSCRRRSWIRHIANQWHLLVPASAAIAMYTLIHVEARYVGVFVALLALGLFSGVRMPSDRASEKLTAWSIVAVSAVLMMSFVPFTVRAVGSLARDLRGGGDESAPVQVAESLRQMGIRRGDEVASIGYGFDALWARLARARIVAEVTSGPFSAPTRDVEMFWASDSAGRDKVTGMLARVGARVVVADRVPKGVSTSGWRRVGATDYYIYPLER